MSIIRETKTHIWVRWFGPLGIKTDLKTGKALPGRILKLKKKVKP